VGHHGQGVEGDTAVAGGVGVGPAPQKSLAGCKVVGRARLTEMPHRCGKGDRSRPDHRAALVLPLLHHSSTATVVIAVQAVRVAHRSTVVRRVNAGCPVTTLQQGSSPELDSS